MAIIQAFIYTTRYIWGDGNYDWYYIMAIAIMFVLFIRKDYNKYFRAMAFFLCLMILTGLCSLLFVSIQHDLTDIIISIGKVMLCSVLMFGTREYFNRLKLEQFLYGVTGFLAFETLIAWIWVQPPLWRLNDVENGFNTTRLQLFYIEPSELSMCAALMLILVVYLIEKSGFRYTYIPCILVFLIDMYLSAGMCGILSLGIAIGGVVFYMAVLWAVRDRKYYGIILFVLLGILAFGLIYGTDIPMMQRTRLILSGEENADSSTTWRLLMPLKAIIPLLVSTHFMGIGLGNFNTPYAAEWRMRYLGWPNGFPNSFMNFATEGGILAILIIVIGVGYLGYRAFRSKKIALIMLFIFIVVYQIPGGYYTNPINWICYGVILSYGNEKENTASVGEISGIE